MPYSRRVVSKRKPARSTKYATKTKTTRKFVKRVIDSAKEMHCQSMIVFNQSATSAGLFSGGWLNAPPQGTSIEDRIGNKCKEKSLEIFGVIGNNANQGYTEPHILRLMVIRDKENVNALPVAADFLQTIANSAWLSSPYDCVNAFRFDILLDVYIKIPPVQALATGVATYAQLEPFHYKIPLNRVLNFIGSATYGSGNLGTVKAGGIFAVAFDTNYDDAFTVEMQAQFSFVDM